MRKYLCNCCGTIFSDDTADVREETMSEEYWGRRETWTETRIYCPYCGDDDFTTYTGKQTEGEIEEDWLLDQIELEDII